MLWGWGTTGIPKIFLNSLHRQKENSAHDYRDVFKNLTEGSNDDEDNLKINSFPEKRERGSVY